jgi:hypothetical protein
VKIRLGFVSNSSTTSFCVYGTSVNEEEAAEYFGIKADEDGWWLDALDKFVCDRFKTGEGANLAFLNDWGKADYDGDRCYLGLSLGKLSDADLDDMTLTQIKQSVRDAVNSITVKPIPSQRFKVLNDAWFDG